MVLIASALSFFPKRIESFTQHGKLFGRKKHFRGLGLFFNRLKLIFYHSFNIKIKME